MKKIFYKLQFALLLLAITNLSFGKESAETKLYGLNSNGGMKLYWEIGVWPEKLDGFVLKKKINDGEWKALNKSTILPQTEKRDWENIGLNQQQASTFDSVYEKYVSEQKLTPEPHNSFIKNIHKNSKDGGLLKDDKDKMRKDFNLAFITGFAALDLTFNNDEKTTYGLFYVNQKGKEDSSPAAIFSPAPVTIQLKPDFSIKNNSMTISWSLDRKIIDQAAVGSFNVFDAIKKVPLTIKLLPQSEDKNKTTWNYTFEVQDPATNGVYAFVPVTIFQTELQPVMVKYEAAANK